jgi:hypothetical protein
MTSFVDRMREAMGWRDEQPTLVTTDSDLAQAAGAPPAPTPGPEMTGIERMLHTAGFGDVVRASHQLADEKTIQSIVRFGHQLDELLAVMKETQNVLAAVCAAAAPGEARADDVRASAASGAGDGAGEPGRPRHHPHDANGSGPGG